MTRSVSQQEFLNSALQLLPNVSRNPIFIEGEDGERVAVVVSPEDYESLRLLRAERAIGAMTALGEHLRSVASPEELEELEKALDRKAP